jgi:creatinine amidohydrolase
MTLDLDRLTSPQFGELVASGRLVVLLPVGSVEPHGPHLALGTDTAISRAACAQACELLADRGITARIAPAIAYGVTDCARRFPGAVSVDSAALAPYVRAVASGYLAAGVHHVCAVNNHLEPAHDRAVRDALAGLAAASVACPLERRWARTLSDEFKSGACHAGRYETSIVLSHDPSLVDAQARGDLPPVPISLSDQLRRGVTDFVEMGLERAYAGDPAAATAAEGRELVYRLGEMIATTVNEHLTA